MYKKFLSAIILVFAFLFLNVSLNNINNVNAIESNLPEDIKDNAGYGEMYWAIANYGSDYVGKDIVIDIQREAIAKIQKFEQQIDAAQKILDSAFARKQAILDKYLR